MSKINKAGLLFGAAAMAVTVYSVPAFAQEADDDNGELRQNVVTITARKTEETLQEAPVAVSVVSAEQIENLALQDLSDISKITAGLSFDNEFGRDSNRPVIRGQANILGASGVSYFIDGVRISGAITDYDLNDIERMEIVKGPQSALYGRNTYSGAINIITKSPADEVTRRVGLQGSSLGLFEATAGISGPITDTLSGGLTLRHYQFNGDFENTFDGARVGDEESFSISGVLYYQPTDDLDIRLRAYNSQSDDGQPALFATDASDNNCFTDNGSLYGGDGRYFCGTIQPRDISTDYLRQIGPNAGTTIDNTQVSLSITKDLTPNWSVTSVTGYNERDVRQITDGDYSGGSFQTANFVPGGFPINILSFAPFRAVYGFPGSVVDFTFASDSAEEEISQELRFNYEGDRMRALVGGYYLDRSDTTQDIRDLPVNAAGLAAENFNAELARQQALCGFNPTCVAIVPLFGPNIDVTRNANEFDIENKAIFGLIGYDITDTLSVTLEGRYAEEDIEQNVTTRNLGDPAVAPVNATASFDSFAPRVTLDWQATPDNLLYGVYAEGQKPGGFNGAVAIQAGLATFDEEEVQSIEIGSKNTLLQGQMTANFAAYFNQIEGYQLTQNARAGANTTSATVNAGDAEIFGVEAEFRFTPDAIDGLTTTLNYAYTDTEFTSGSDQNQGVLNDAADDGLVNGSVGCEILTDPTDPTSACLQNAFGSIVGKRIPRTAEHQAFFDVDYRQPFGTGDWEWFTGANVSYESSKFAQVHNQAETGDTTLVGARIGVSNGPLTMRVWGRNLTDEDSTTLVLRYADGNDSFKRNFVGTARRGSEVGVALDVEF